VTFAHPGEAVTLCTRLAQVFRALSTPAPSPRNLARALSTHGHHHPYEWVGRAVNSSTDPSEEDGYLLGATLLYLLDRFHERRRPFAVYTIGHTHRPNLIRFDVRAEYTSTAHEEATSGETRP
jgi:hypothetical protein